MNLSELYVCSKERIRKTLRDALDPGAATPCMYITVTLYKTFPLGWSRRLVTSPGQWSPKFFFNTGLGDGKHRQIPATKKNQLSRSGCRVVVAKIVVPNLPLLARSESSWNQCPLKRTNHLWFNWLNGCVSSNGILLSAPFFLHWQIAYLPLTSLQLSGISPPDLFFPLFCWGNRILCHHNSSWPWSLLRSWPMSGEVPNVFSKFQVIWIVGPSAIQREKKQNDCLPISIGGDASLFPFQVSAWRSLKR